MRHAVRIADDSQAGKRPISIASPVETIPPSGLQCGPEIRLDPGNLAPAGKDVKGPP
jgi:hypothetical protein